MDNSRRLVTCGYFLCSYFCSFCIYLPVLIATIADYCDFALRTIEFFIRRPMEIIIRLHAVHCCFLFQMVFNSHLIIQLWLV